VSLGVHQQHRGNNMNVRWSLLIALLTPRKYKIEGGSDDSAGEVTYYYDARGALRFAFALTNAINGTQREDRVYYDSAGVQLFKASRLLTGPGYGEGGFGTDPVRDPAANMKALCARAS
jgi:hypothetical protein